MIFFEHNRHIFVFGGCELAEQQITLVIPICIFVGKHEFIFILFTKQVLRKHDPQFKDDQVRLEVLFEQWIAEECVDLVVNSLGKHLHYFQAV